MMTYNQLQVAQDVAQALCEDIGSGDLTHALLPASSLSTAKVITREPCVVAGIPWFEQTLKLLDEQAVIDWYYDDGDHVAANACLCEIRMQVSALLAGERTALNFLQTLSATATKTAAYVACVPSTCQLLDTRKTLPGLRAAQKYAVRCGGGHNHRLGLYDMVLLKENHLLACGGIEVALQRAVATYPREKIEVEVEDLDQCQTALSFDIQRIMLDNFSDDAVCEAVRLRGERKVSYELSGNLTIATLSSRQLSGVDFVSIGDLTKNIQAIDLSMRVIQVSE